MSAAPEAVVATGGTGDSGPLIGHYPHPNDPSERTALCGQKILGIDAFGEYEVCEMCRLIDAAHETA